MALDAGGLLVPKRSPSACPQALHLCKHIRLLAGFLVAAPSPPCTHRHPTTTATTAARINAPAPCSACSFSLVVSDNEIKAVNVEADGTGLTCSLSSPALEALKAL